jgi:hypothetical protein
VQKFLVSKKSFKVLKVYESNAKRSKNCVSKFVLPTPNCSEYFGFVAALWAVSQRRQPHRALLGAQKWIRFQL